MGKLTTNGTAPATGIPNGLLLGAGIGNTAVGLIVGVALGVSLEIAGRRRRERNTR